MRNVVIAFACAVLTMSLVARSNASGYLMGGITSVRPYGASDITRNPALLPSLGATHSLGGALFYQNIVSLDSSFKIAQAALILPDFKSHSNPNARASYVIQSRDLFLGFDLYGNYEQLNSATTTIASVTGLPVVGFGATRNNTSSLNGSFSLGFSVAPRHSLGLLLNCNYSRNLQVSTQRTAILSPTVIIPEHNRDLTESISTSPGIGYHGIFDFIELGFTMKAGKLELNKLFKDAEKVISSSAGSDYLVKAHRDIPYTLQYSSGPSFVAGLYSRPFGTVAVGFEGEFQVPVKYGHRSLLSDDSFKYFILQIDSTIINKPSWSVRGGFEFFITRRTIFSLGGGLISTGSRSRAPNRVIQKSGSPAELLIVNKQYSTTFAYYGSGGFDFFFGKKSTATLGVQVTNYKLENKAASKFPGVPLELPSVINKISIIDINLFAACTTGF